MLTIGDGCVSKSDLAPGRVESRGRGAFFAGRRLGPVELVI